MKKIQKIIEGENSECQYRFEIGFTHFKGQAPYFSITGTTWEIGKPQVDRYSMRSGALTLGDYVPKLAYLDKYHLMSTESPMHYVANSLYHASNKDHNGLLRGERRQIVDGRTKEPCWHLVAVNKITGEEVELYDLKKSIDSASKPECEFTLEYRPWYCIGEGKEPNLAAARASAVWPEAELSDFTKEKLEARLPELMKRFKKDIEKAGLMFPEEGDK